MAKDWRKHVHPELREHLEMQVRATFPYKKAYDDADNKGNAQLWVAIAHIAKQLNQMGKKLDATEQALRELEAKARGMSGQGEISFVEDEMPAIETIPEPELSEMPSLTEMKELEDVDELLADMKLRKKAGRSLSLEKKALGKKTAKKSAKGKRLKKSLKRF